MADYDLSARISGGLAPSAHGGPALESQIVVLDAKTLLKEKGITIAATDNVTLYRVPLGSIYMGSAWQIVRPNVGAATFNLGYTGALTAVATAQAASAAAWMSDVVPAFAATALEFILTTAVADLDELVLAGHILLAPAPPYNPATFAQ